MSEILSETPNPGEPQASNPAPDQEYQRAAEATAEIFQEMQNNLRQSSEKTYTSLIDYTDRIILLAGGTLTLTFTAVATVGAHLRENHHDATHIEYVTTACWMLMATIVLGLIHNSYIIRLRDREAVQNSLGFAHIQTKLKLLSLTGRANLPAIEAIPPPPGSEDPRTLARTVRYLHAGARVSSFLSMFALLFAFLNLTLFIQDNIRAMLSQ